MKWKSLIDKSVPASEFASKRGATSKKSQPATSCGKAAPPPPPISLPTPPPLQNNSSRKIKGKTPAITGANLYDSCRAKKRAQSARPGFRTSQTSHHFCRAFPVGLAFEKRHKPCPNKAPGQSGVHPAFLHSLQAVILFSFLCPVCTIPALPTPPFRSSVSVLLACSHPPFHLVLPLPSPPLSLPPLLPSCPSPDEE